MRVSTLRKVWRGGEPSGFVTSDRTLHPRTMGNVDNTDCIHASEQILQAVNKTICGVQQHSTIVMIQHYTTVQLL